MPFAATLVDSSGPNMRTFECAFSAAGDITGVLSIASIWTPEYVIITPANNAFHDARIFATIAGTTVTFTKAAGVGGGAAFLATIGRSDKK